MVLLNTFGGPSVVTVVSCGVLPFCTWTPKRQRARTCKQLAVLLTEAEITVFDSVRSATPAAARAASRAAAAERAMATEGAEAAQDVAPTRPWPEVYDLCHTILHIQRVKKHTDKVLHARIARVSRAILACPCVF